MLQFKIFIVLYLIIKIMDNNVNINNNNKILNNII